MSSSFGNIGDSFPDKEIKCRVRGCKNTVRISAKAALLGIAQGKSRPERMCDECYAKLQTLEDKEMPCSKPGCDGVWTWSRYQQLDALASGRTNLKPRGFCQKCLDEMKNVQDQEIPCRMKGCKNTWTLTAREQLELGGKPIPHKLCDECFKKLNSLQDIELKCRIHGCEHTVLWNRFQQLEHILAGKSLDNPPARMCDDCFNIFKNLKPQEHQCRIRGCKNTWTYSTYDQLEQIVKAKNEGITAKAEKNDENAGDAENSEKEPVAEGQVPVPSRMCNECFNFFKNAEDIQVPCKNHFCKNTWTYTRSMQLAQKQHGRTQPPARYCDECAAKLATLEDKEMPCMHKGCTGSWLYIKDEQLKDLTAGREPKPHSCQRCSEFLKSHPSIDVKCEKCGRSIEVSNMQQLECELGVSVKPSLCADCSQEKLKEELSGDDIQATITRPKIYIPRTGEWNEQEETRNLPKYLSRELIDEMADAKVRIVCLGDEMTLSCDDTEKSWPVALKKELSERMEGIGLFNAGMPKSTTALDLKRLGRDVAPFKPQLVIFSSVFADAMSLSPKATDEETAAFMGKLAEDLKALIAAIAVLEAKPLCWLPNAIFPAESKEFKFDPEAASRVNAIYEQVISVTRRICESEGVSVVDAHALFLASGDKVARHCMANWFLHNEAGAATMASWMKNEIRQSVFTSETGSSEEN